MTDIANLDVGELAAYVQAHLQREDIDAVLTGGSAVSIYSKNLYVSKDIDLVSDKSRKHIKSAMEKIGFQEKDRYFTHPNTEYLIEFPAGPLAIGREPVSEINEIRLATGVLKIITPTDCVKDRLSAFFFWNDRQALSQAILVANHQSINHEEVERWANQEGMHSKFDNFTRHLSEK